MVKTILIDDERPALKALEYQLKNYDKIEIAGQYTDIAEAFKKIEEDSTIDLVFLDIEMPKMNGIEVAEKLLNLKNGLQIVFVTAYDNYAVEAFEVNVADYIMKPVIKRRLDKTINRILKKFSLGTEDQKKENEIKCFSNFRWIHYTQDIKWRTLKTKELIAYLVHQRGKFVHRDKIIDSLWPDKKLDKAVKLLYTSIYNIRKALKDIGIEDGILYSGEMYKLNIQSLYCDLYHFEEVFSGEKLITKENVKELESVVQLYRGDYLEEEDYIWAKEEQERLIQLYTEALIQLASFHKKSGNYTKEIFYLKKALQKNYYVEEIHRRVLMVYKELGDITSFNEHYDEAKKVFHADLGKLLRL